MNFNSALITDCGSTTTKAILVLKDDKGAWYMAARGEAPTTVESPFDDVTIGVINSALELEVASGRKLVDRDTNTLITPEKDGVGVDMYLSTSSAGGGLQMTAAGVVSSMSAESAKRASLGAGAIIIDTISVDDGRKTFEKIERFRKTRPDMILMSGGTDGGTKRHLLELAEMILSADPKPRLGKNLKMPVIYAGNIDARADVAKILGSVVDLRFVDNIRPSLDCENLDGARNAIHELFLEHVMQQAPGYQKLSDWVSADIMSTPNAFGNIISKYAENTNQNVLAVDIGGATTDVFSVFNGVYTRTVSANLGMSYSIGNVLFEAGTENIKSWLHFELTDDYLRNTLRNKMIRPTIIPYTMKDLHIEQATAREALRLSFVHHKNLARSLKGVQTVREMGDIVDQKSTGGTIVNMTSLDIIIGSGGVLSHAPRRAQTAFMLVDSFQPEGVTMLAVDSIFMMPHLGVLSSVDEKAATEVFGKDCLIKLGHVVSPVGSHQSSKKHARLVINNMEYNIPYGTIKLIKLPKGDYSATLFPNAHNVDFGAGRGKSLSCTLTSGEVGIIIDLRNRVDSNPEKIASYHRELDLPLVD